MRWPIRNQIFVPFAAVLLVAVASIAVTMAVLAAQRGTRERADQLHRVEATLADAGFPFTQNVLRKMRGLSGAEFVALGPDGTVVTSTFEGPLGRGDLPSRLPASGPPKNLDEFDAVEVAGIPYSAAVLPGSANAGIASLLILYPQENLRRARWDAAWPPLAIGGTTILLMVGLSAWLSRRLARRIESVRGLFGRIADGDFSHVQAEPPFDEVHDLVLSANRLSDQLAAVRDQAARTERLRLLAQLAGGLAHQLRNAVTGARMAVQLHQRRCPARDADQSLDVALRQLTLTEEQVRGLLSLGKLESRAPSPGLLSTVVADVERLILPSAQHAHVAWSCETLGEKSDLQLVNTDSVRAGLLNLVLNAIEAAGNGGRARLWLERTPSHLRVCVGDSGKGPPAAVRSTLFEPFVTSKPEGIGLGLALAQAAAQEHGGELSWSRIDGQTIFTMSLAAAGGPADVRQSSLPQPLAQAEFSRST
jgi:signal transduction histidine kinase